LVENDSEPDGDAGDFRFQFNVVKPDGTQELAVHSEREKTLGAEPLPLGQLGLPWSQPGKPKADGIGWEIEPGTCPEAKEKDRCFVTTENGTIDIIRIIDLQSLPFGLNGEGRTKDMGSVSTTDAVPESFGVRGWLEERDGLTHTTTSCRVEIFPDAFGDPQTGTGLVKGSQLRLGENTMAITRTIADGGCAENPKSLKFTLMVSYTAL
jgi:hypothetical protein